MKRAGLNRTALGKAVDVSQQAITYILERDDGSVETVRKIAAVLSVPFEWLTVGDNPPAWAADRSHRMLRESTHSYGETAVLDVEGQVSAGPGDIDQWADVGGRLRFGPRWAAVRVRGDSAYPVVYPDQYALVDYDRAVTVAELDEQRGWDLDDDVVLVRLHNGGALLKRFCYHPPDFVLASVNGGRRSPLVRREDIHCIVPVVGTIYHGADERPAERWKDKKAQRGKR